MKLYLIHAGYYDYAVGFFELHTQFLIPALTPSEAKQKTLNLDLFKIKKMHIDGICEINSVENYQIRLEKSAELPANKTYAYQEIKEL